MIINELAYKVTIKADEFLNGKRKVQEEVSKLNKTLSRSEKEQQKEIKKQREELEKFSKSAASATRSVMAVTARFLGIGTGLYGIKQLFASTANEIVRASTQAKFFGSNVNKLFGMHRGFQQAGLNGDAFIGASGSTRMALANIADPTIFGGLTGAAQNLMVLGARTGLNINNLGDPNKALAEFTRYGRGHSQANLMQVMAAAGFDPTDAAKIKSGKLKRLVDSETKKSNITAAQVKEQEALAIKMGELGSQMHRVAQGIAIAFSPEVISEMESFGKWIETHQGDIIGFFNNAGDKVKAFTEAVGGAENALKILAGMYVGGKAIGLAASWRKAAGATWDAVGGLAAGAAEDAGAAGAAVASGAAGLLVRLSPWLALLYSKDAGSPDEFKRIHSTYRKRSLSDRNNNPGNIRASSGFRSFSSEQEGWDAMSSQLMRYFNGKTTGKKLRTVKDIISAWAPSSENDTSSYIKQVSSYLGVGANDQINLADPNVMAKLRTAMARHEGFRNWQNGLKLSGSNQYYLQQQSLANARMLHTAANIDNSQSSKTVIDKVIVNTNPQTVDALTSSVKQQAKRAATNSSLATSVN